MRKKILMVVYWDLGIGGIQKMIRDFVAEMSKRQDDWHIYIFLRKKAQEGFDGQIKTGKNVSLMYYPLKKPFGTRLEFLVFVAWQMIRLKPQVILTFLHVLSPTIVYIKRLLFWIPAKVVLNESIVVSRHFAIDRAIIFPSLVKLTYPHADTIIVPTKACQVDLERNYSIPRRKIAIIPNWTCLLPQKPLAPVFDCFYLGRFHPEKNPLGVVDITKVLYRDHPNIRVGMMGNGQLLQELRDAIQSAGLSQIIHILPFSQDVTHVLRRSKILVVSSFAEGMPNVVLEAAICGVPSVVNHFPGAEEVVCHGKTGYISETITDAATYIDYLLRHAQKRKRMGIAAQRYVAKYFSRATQKRFIETLVSE